MYLTVTVIFFPAHPASFTHNFFSGMQSFLFQRIPECNGILSIYLLVLPREHFWQALMSIADLSWKIVFRLISLHLDPSIWETVSPKTHKPKIVNESLLSVNSIPGNSCQRRLQLAFDWDVKPQPNTTKHTKDTCNVLQKLKLVMKHLHQQQKDHTPLRMTCMRISRYSVETEVRHIIYTYAGFLVYRGAN